MATASDRQAAKHTADVAAHDWEYATLHATRSVSNG